MQVPDPATKKIQLRIENASLPFFVAYKQRQILETVILLSLFTGQQTDNEKLIVAIFKKF